MLVACGGADATEDYTPPITDQHCVAGELALDDGRCLAAAAITSFDADVAIQATAIECNPIDLDGETAGQRGFEFQDLGGNVCGCAGQTRICQVSSRHLTPPATLEPP